MSSKEVLDYLGFRDSKFMHAAFQLLGEPWDGSRMDFGETVKCIAQFCMFGADSVYLNFNDGVIMMPHRQG